MTVPTRNQIAAQVEAVLRRETGARCIAIRSDRAGAWPEALTIAGHEFGLRWCGSPLALRGALVELDKDAEGRRVLLTPLGEPELGADALARVARCRVFEVENWEIVRQLFRATDLDARLASHGWIANLLVEQAPPEGYAPVPSGFLDLDTAWKAVLEASIDLSGPRPDLTQLLAWTTRSVEVVRFTGLADSVRQEVARWIAECAGGPGSLVMEAVVTGQAADAVPLGLVCGVVFAPGADAVPDLAAAAVRLERHFGGRRVGPEDGRKLAEASASVLRAVDPGAASALLERADQLLDELHIAAHAGLSDLLPAGFEARLEAFGSALQSASAGDARTADLALRARAVLSHGFAARTPARTERVRMAARIARWLAAGGQTLPAPGAFPAAYTQHGAFVDLARMKLMGGDELAGLSSAYGALAERVRTQREQENAGFAKALAQWNREGGEIDGCVPVEQVLERVLGPVASATPVLLLVVDGLSLPIFEELARDVAAHGWSEIVPEGRARALVGIAALPTVTEVSRTSLLSGRLATGAANNEKTAFASHPALVAASRAGRKPVLFHKGDLGDVTGLSETVRDAVSDRDQRVIGVVFNAVDDNLGGSDQLHPRWTLDDLRLLKPLLHEARLAGRALVVTADHGHVLEERSVQRTSSEGDRWRQPGGAVEQDEVLLAGGRVRSPNGGDRVVCAWSERVRFGSRKNGYHGGASPQEVLVPLSVFVPSRTPLAGWMPAPPRSPEWWDPAPVVVQERAAPAPKAPVPGKARRPKPVAQVDLFGEAAAQPQAIDWIAAVLACPTYEQQRRLAARVAPADAQMRSLLEALDGRGGTLSKSALAQRLGLPLMRVSGFVTAARRVLNVDQSPVIELDETSGEVRLNLDLLSLQFQVAIR